MWLTKCSPYNYNRCYYCVELNNEHFLPVYLSGMPWQTTLFTDVHTDLGKPPYRSGDGYALCLIVSWCTMKSISSVVIPTWKPQVKTVKLARFCISQHSNVYVTLLVSQHLPSDCVQQVEAHVWPADMLGLGLRSALGLWSQCSLAILGPV